MHLILVAEAIGLGTDYKFYPYALYDEGRCATMADVLKDFPITSVIGQVASQFLVDRNELGTNDMSVLLMDTESDYETNMIVLLDELVPRKNCLKLRNAVLCGAGITAQNFQSLALALIEFFADRGLFLNYMPGTDDAGN